MQKLRGWVEQGNMVVSVGGLLSTTKVQKSFPLATVTVYLKSPLSTINIVSIVRASNLVTVTLPYDAGFVVGSVVTIAGVSNSSFNGTFTIASVSGVNFTYAQAASNASSSGGTADSVRKAAIYSDDDNPPTPLTNPFTANADGSWDFFANPGIYDVVFSGAGVSIPFTLEGLGYNISTFLGGAYLSAADFPGNTADQQIAAAISVLPSTGGIINAQSLIGNQTWVSNPFAGVTKPVTLLLGAATFNCESIVSVPSNCSIVGYGNASILNFIDDGTPTSKQLYINGVSDVVVRDLTVTSTATSRTGLYGLVRIESSSNILILNNKLLVSPSTSIHVINATNLLIQGNTCIGPFADGIHVTRQSTKVRIEANSISDTGDDGIALISYTDPGDTWLDNEQIVVVNNNISNVSVGRGISVYGGKSIVVSGNTIEDTDQTGIIVSAIGGALSTSSTHFPKKIVVSDNTIKNAGRNYAAFSGQGSGIYVNPARIVTLHGNIVEITGQDGITLAGVAKDIIVDDNQVSQPTGRGISVDATASIDARLIQELFTDLGELGVVTALTASIKVSDNIIRIPNAEGVYFNIAGPDFIYGVIVTDTHVEDSAAATDAMRFFRVRHLIVSDNRINNCSEGIRFSATDHFTASGNVVTNSADGFLLIGATFGLIGTNTITDNITTGVFIDNTSSDNAVINNIFRSNGVDIQDSGARTTKANRYGVDQAFNIDNLLFAKITGATLTTTFTNGTGAAFPTNIENMWTVNINGIDYKVPLVKP